MIERVAFSGAMASGKSAAANFLRREYGFVEMGFATPLYEIDTIHKESRVDWFRHLARWGCIYLAPLGLSDTEHRRFIDETIEAFERIAPTREKNRTLLQHVGTEVGRAIDEDLWVRIFAGAVENASEGTRITNSNLRFGNELACLGALGFTTVYLDVPDEVCEERYLTAYGVRRSPEQKSHASEAVLAEVGQGCDYHYRNTGTLQDLYDFLDRLVDSDFRGEHAKEQTTEKVKEVA